LKLKGFRCSRLPGELAVPDPSNSLRAVVDGPGEEKIEVFIETCLKKQLGLTAHTVTKVEETERYMIVHIDRLGVSGE
jgi:hypothetical protein